MINTARQSDGQGVSNQQLFDYWKQKPSGVNMSTTRHPGHFCADPSASRSDRSHLPLYFEEFNFYSPILFSPT